MPAEAGESRRGSSRFLAFFRSRPVLLVAFALAIMADPVSSVACAIEAALGALGGDLRLLLPTMGLVVLVIAAIVLNYRQVVSRFPEGGGAAAASGKAFGEAWTFLPIGALIVDFVLAINLARAAAIVSLGTSLLIALGLYALWVKKGRPRGISGAGA